MQKQINQISLKIALNLLSDYIKQRTLQLTHIHERFAREFISKQEVDLHQWLITETKGINDTVKIVFQGTRDYFTDLKFDFVYSFFQKCLEVQEQNCKYLTQAIMEKINKKIDVVRPHIFVPPAPPVILGTNEKQVEEHKEERLKRYSKEINRDLESLDYFLNLLTYEDSKTYEEYKNQCDKILLQRQLLENIKPSEASKQIMETANMIDNVMENSDKVFQDSYLLKYMEFKSFLNDLKKPEEINELYKEDMENATKQKFKDGMNRTLKKCYAINKRENLKNKISSAVQTDEIKGAKYQQKLQNLLIIEKKNTEKLSNQIKVLKKNKSNLEDQNEIQKVLEREQLRQKQSDNKYRILENMYNEKCEELQKLPYQKIYVPKEVEKKQLIAISTQTQQQKTNVSAQTDLDFYYYFQSNKIYDFKVKIIELEQELKHKQYMIREMEALRTFRDNFKSKKQVYETAIRSGRKIERAKTLHYLDQNDEIYDIRNEEKKGELSQLSGLNTKKKVTLQDLDESGEARRQAISHSKKNKKKTQTFKNKPYFALNSKIQDEVEEVENKSQCQIQKVSIKSILKLGSNQFKKQASVQTESEKNGYALDYVIQQGIGKSKIEKVKLSSRDRSERSAKMSKLKPRQSQTSNFKDSKQKKYIFDEPINLRRSNFVALGQLNDHKQEKMNMTINASLRPSGISGMTSPKRLLTKTEKPSYFTRASKWNESKVNTIGNEILHVNNSLNCNFLAPITNNLKPTVSNPSLMKNKSKYETNKKTNRIM